MHYVVGSTRCNAQCIKRHAHFHDSTHKDSMREPQSIIVVLQNISISSSQTISTVIQPSEG